MKLWVSQDELWPYYTFSRKRDSIYDHCGIEATNEEWHEYKKKHDEFWEAYQKLASKVKE
jgi:phytoene/squalene synthetase